VFHAALKRWSCPAYQKISSAFRGVHKLDHKQWKNTCGLVANIPGNRNEYHYKSHSKNYWFGERVWRQYTGNFYGI